VAGWLTLEKWKISFDVANGDRIIFVSIRHIKQKGVFHNLTDVISVGKKEKTMVTATLKWTTCGAEFVFSPATYTKLGLSAIPKKCPTCCDVARHADHIQQSKKLVSEFAGVRFEPDLAEFINQHMVDFRTVDADIASRKFIMLGSNLGHGVVNTGRINLYFNGIEKLDPEKIYDLRHMEVVKEKILPPPTEEEIEKHKKEDGEVKEPDTRLSYRYVVVEEADEGTHERYVFLRRSSYSKTTLSGRVTDRHRSDRIDSSLCVYENVLSSAVRSGRIHGSMQFAILETEVYAAVQEKREVE